VAALHYTFTHKQYTEYTERNIHNNQKRKKKIGKYRPCPIFVSYTLAFALQLRKKHGKSSVRVVEKCPDIPVAVVQYTFTHKQYTEYTERNIHNNQKRKKKIGKYRPCPIFVSYTLAFALQLRKKHGKTSVRVVEKCPDMPVAVVQYTFTHKQYTEQHNETEYTEKYITIRILKLTKEHITL
jgi:hypothetical protein